VPNHGGGIIDIPYRDINSVMLELVLGESTRWISKVNYWAIPLFGTIQFFSQVRIELAPSNRVACPPVGPENSMVEWHQLLHRTAALTSTNRERHITAGREL
tara:strand:+ start:8979 stop:9284 length:306 start_codon:yes stop_codon:yes gene_type:complete